MRGRALRLSIPHHRSRRRCASIRGMRMRMRTRSRVPRSPRRRRTLHSRSTRSSSSSKRLQLPSTLVIPTDSIRARNIISWIVLRGCRTLTLVLLRILRLRRTSRCIDLPLLIRNALRIHRARRTRSMRSRRSRSPWFILIRLHIQTRRCARRSQRSRRNTRSTSSIAQVTSIARDTRSL